MGYVEEKMQSNSAVLLRSYIGFDNGLIPDEVNSNCSYDAKNPTELTTLIKENGKLGNKLRFQTMNTIISDYIEYTNCYSIMRRFFLDELLKYIIYFENRDLYNAIERSNVENKENIPVLQYFSKIGKRFYNAKFIRKIIDFKNKMNEFKRNQKRIDKMIETKTDNNTVV